MLGKRKTKDDNTFLGFLDTISDVSERDLDVNPTLGLIDTSKQPKLVKRAKLTDKTKSESN